MPTYLLVAAFAGDRGRPRQHWPPAAGAGAGLQSIDCRGQERRCAWAGDESMQSNANAMEWNGMQCNAMQWNGMGGGGHVAVFWCRQQLDPLLRRRGWSQEQQLAQDWRVELLSTSSTALSLEEQHIVSTVAERAERERRTRRACRAEHPKLRQEAGGRAGRRPSNGQAGRQVCQYNAC